MGFSFKKFKPKNLFDSGKSLIGGIGEGALNLATFGGYAQEQATKEAKKARDQAAAQYNAQIAAAEATAKQIADEEEERKRRLALAGTQLPSTLVNSYLGVSGPANVRRAMLG